MQHLMATRLIIECRQVDRVAQLTHQFRFGLDFAALRTAADPDSHRDLCFCVCSIGYDVWLITNDCNEHEIDAKLLAQ